MRKPLAGRKASESDVDELLDQMSDDSRAKVSVGRGRPRKPADEKAKTRSFSLTDEQSEAIDDLVMRAAQSRVKLSRSDVVAIGAEILSQSEDLESIFINYKNNKNK